MIRKTPLKRSPMPQRSAPMPRKRSGKRRRGDSDDEGTATTPKARKALKSRSTPKMTPARKSAEKQDCTLCLPGCRNDTETVVLCHLRMFGGGGMGLKPWDGEAVYACHYCHDLLDNRQSMTIYERTMEPINKFEYVAFALIRTHRIMRAKGILMMKGEEE